MGVHVGAEAVPQSASLVFGQEDSVERGGEARGRRGRWGWHVGMAALVDLRETVPGDTYHPAYWRSFKISCACTVTSTVR